MEVTDIKYPRKDSDVILRKLDKKDYGVKCRYSYGTIDEIVYYVNDIDLKGEGFTIIEIGVESTFSVKFVFNGMLLVDDATNRALTIAAEEFPDVFKVEGNKEYAEYPNDYITSYTGEYCIRSDRVHVSSGPYLFIN